MWRGEEEVAEDEEGEERGERKRFRAAWDR